MLRRLVNIFKRGETAIKTPQIEKTEITIKKEENIMDSVKGFNSITSAATKITAGAALAGSILINNSQHQDSEVKKVASSKAEDIFDSDIF